MLMIQGTPGARARSAAFSFLFGCTAANLEFSSRKVLSAMWCAGKSIFSARRVDVPRSATYCSPETVLSYVKWTSASDSARNLTSTSADGESSGGDSFLCMTLALVFARDNSPMWNCSLSGSNLSTEAFRVPSWRRRFRPLTSSS